ncbi:antA/AntB antirepressor family protein [Pokkaliibacter sp. MBI-7]|uniref:antA/AntB antirepressor family protein n=1 Tax=Pokkaliibacter sp. MBI-7 TaxID=3040600 RepID=UPI00244A2B85|nr:antA/AntB antirepressor family protein [Pokkaliibacter sp. MBI-7]MDH2435604.1 antA/AntB antirepressor family protein [Pokkaliibacter sp. MBI-7]
MNRFEPPGTHTLYQTRERHTFLGVGKVFAAWVQERIEQYGFIENQDYLLTVSKTGIRRNVTQKDYHITLDMAKELAMVERNDNGRSAR